MDPVTFLASRLKWAEDSLRRLEEEDAQDARVRHYRRLREGYSQALEELRDLRSKTKPLPRDLGDISDLPADLIDQLSAVKTDSAEDQLVTVINSLGGSASLDQILIGMYRKFGVVQTRRFVQNKLWRMSHKGFVWAVPGRKGIYTTKIPDGDWNNAREPSQAPNDELDELDDEIPF